jgi:hypothetical protein
MDFIPPNVLDLGSIGACSSHVRCQHTADRQAPSAAMPAVRFHTFLPSGSASTIFGAQKLHLTHDPAFD